MSELLNYLKTVQQLEVNLYTNRTILPKWRDFRNKLIDDRNNTISANQKNYQNQITNTKKNIQQNLKKIEKEKDDQTKLEQLAEENYPLKQIKSPTNDFLFFVLWLLGYTLLSTATIIVPAIGALIGALFGGLINVIRTGDNTNYTVLLEFAIIGAIIAPIIVACIYAIDKFKDQKSNKRFNQEQLQNRAEYIETRRATSPSIIRKYTQTNEVLNQKLTDLLSQTPNLEENAPSVAEIEKATQAVQKLEATNDALQNQLQRLYGMNYIHEKYRSLIPVSMFCDYFDTGRCDSLTGHEGAYNLYESELRQAIIIGSLGDIEGRLDGIKGHLDGLKTNMYCFATSMKSALNTINQNMITNANQMESRISSLDSQFSGLQSSADNILKQLESGVKLNVE